MDPEVICKDTVGINIAYARFGTYGKALYFTRDASVKDKDKAFICESTRLRKLVVAQVIVGKCAHLKKTDNSLTKPP